MEIIFVHLSEVEKIIPETRSVKDVLGTLA